MRKFEVSAYSLEEAKMKAAEMGMTVVRNVTQSWKNANCPVTDKEFKIFEVEMLEKLRLTQAEGVGLIVAVVPGSKDTRERPYKIHNNVVEGKKETRKVVEIRLKDTDELIGEADNKGSAAKLAKELMLKYKAPMVARIVYRVIDDKDVAFTIDYVPSASAKEGKYIVFGNESN